MGTNTMYISLEERVENFKRYYARTNERPLLGFFVGSEYPLYRYKAAGKLPTNRPLQPEDFPVEPYVEDSHRLFAQHEECGGDFIWSASAFWGIPWLEAAMGCSILADHSTGSLFARPPEEPTLPNDGLTFDPDSPWLRKLDEFLAGLRQGSSGRWPIGTTRMRGIADLLSARYGGDRFVFAMMEHPEEVHSACDCLTDFWIEFARFQLKCIPAFHGGIGSFYYNMWVPSGTVWHQEDAAALLSPTLYDRFIRPCDERIVKALDGCIMHLHPTGFVPVDACLEMKMTGIELHVDAGEGNAKELVDLHLKILEKRPLLIWGHLSDADLDHIFSQLPSKGLAVMTVISDAAEAARLWQRYMV